MRKSETEYFFDSVTLSNFALSGRLDLLLTRYGKRAVLTSEVLDEIAQGVAAGYEPLRAIIEAVSEDNFSTAALRNKERKQYADFLRTLGSGEASAILCAKARDGIVVTDDKAARKHASANDIPFTGTLGILKRLALDESLTPDEADAILSDMVRHGFYSPIRRISEIL